MIAITKDQWFKAMNKAMSNASSLVADAKLLKEHGRYARAYTLFQLALEESAKASMVFDFLFLSDDYMNVENQKNFLKKFRDHIPKIEASILQELHIAYRVDDSRLREILLRRYFAQKENIDNINKVKNWSLYTSWINTDFYSPQETISKEIVDNIELTAEIRLSTSKVHLEIGEKHFDEMLKAKASITLEDIEAITLPDELEKIAYEIGYQRGLEERKANQDKN